MSAVREAFVLPGLFLTVALLGGLRVGTAVRLIPPPLSAAVLAVVLLAALVHARVLLPAAFMASDRRPLENLSGAVVLLTLLAASAQAINLVIPDRGLLHVGFAVFLFVQFLSLSAAGIDRVGMLRSLAVLLGSALVLRFIVLESVYAADGGTIKRLVTALMAGVTLGGIEYQPNAPVTGYAAFFTLALYLTGLVLLPSRPEPAVSALATSAVRNGLTVPLLILALAMTSACKWTSQAQSRAAAMPTSSEDRLATEKRDAALASARVWTPPVVPPGQVDFSRNPELPGGFDEDEEVSCRLKVERVGGLTSKFNCELADGTVMKVKYGYGNAELYTEVVATRLLTALGFPADRMFVVRRVRCAGCPRFPYPALRCLQATSMRWPCFPAGIDFEDTRTFDPVVIERRLEGRRIESYHDQGWAWHELHRIDPSRGGSPIAEVDAMRLLAAFLAHWDNKAENQRLICPPGSDTPDGGCAKPVAMMQDVGGTFGPAKLDLHNWRTTPVWADPVTCLVSMEQLPYEGATFPERRISEQGRQFLLALIEQLSADQIGTLFTASRAIAFEGVSAQSRNPSAWVGAFADRVRQIRQAGPCPLVTDD